MRIPTSQFYDRSSSAMGSLTGRADTLQAQISSGKRITRPSDDTSAYRQLTTIARAKTDETANASNITFAQGLLSASDTALGTVQSQLDRASELAIQANSGSLTIDQKATIATELDSILDDLVSVANSRGNDGAPLFGGATGDVAYTRASDGTVSYAGTGQRGAVPIGDGTEVHATTSGDRIFGGLTTSTGATDVFAVLGKLSAALRSGGDTSAASADLKLAQASVTNARASLGARGARLDIESDRLKEVAVGREETRSAIEDTDVTATITELQKTLTTLQATQASFTKLSSLSLFDYLR